MTGVSTRRLLTVVKLLYGFKLSFFFVIFFSQKALLPANNSLDDGGLFSVRFGWFLASVNFGMLCLSHRPLKLADLLRVVAHVSLVVCNPFIRSADRRAFLSLSLPFCAAGRVKQG